MSGRPLRVTFYHFRVPCVIVKVLLSLTVLSESFGILSINIKLLVGAKRCRVGICREFENLTKIQFVNGR